MTNKKAPIRDEGCWKAVNCALLLDDSAADRVDQPIESGGSSLADDLFGFFHPSHGRREAVDHLLLKVVDRLGYPGSECLNSRMMFFLPVFHGPNFSRTDEEKKFFSVCRIDAPDF